jgi:hypothetical protein
MEQLFRSTGNSALVAHGTRLIDRIRQGARALPRVQFAAARGPTSDPAAVAASDRRRSTEAAVSVEELVQVVAETVHANWAVLYASASGSPQQVAATDGAMTKSALDSRVSALIAACPDDDAETSMMTLDEAAPTPDDEAVSLTPILRQDDGKVWLVGIVATDSKIAVPAGLLDQMADCLEGSRTDTAPFDEVSIA